jgi:heme A synthase
MTTVMLELLVAGLIVVLVASLARLAWVARRRRDLRGPITEVQARENAAPLTKAILPSDRRERTRP